MVPGTSGHWAVVECDNLAPKNGLGRLLYFTGSSAADVDIDYLTLKKQPRHAGPSRRCLSFLHRPTQ
ncbi:MAG: hypothetical protein ABJF10_24885 [Chthoniobacter sp.]|uniref:hypothetical protein n=1 Tax=Chthoniobacter sp. TaxID=2510640 RepID=UPI0032AA97EE